MHFDHDDILVITSGFRTDPEWMYKRLPRLWARAGNRVLWIEQPPFPPQDWMRPGFFSRGVRGSLVELEDNLWVGSAPPGLPRMHKGGVLGPFLRACHRPWLTRRIRCYLERLNLNPVYLILMQQSARWDLCDVLPHRWSLYYSYDIVGFGNGTPSMFREEERCCRRVDAVFTTSESVCRTLSAYNPNCACIPHAVDPEWWLDNKDRRPEAYARIPAPRLVFTVIFTGKWICRFCLTLPDLDRVIILFSLVLCAKPMWRRIYCARPSNRRICIFWGRNAWKTCRRLPGT